MNEAIDEVIEVSSPLVEAKFVVTDEEQELHPPAQEIRKVGSILEGNWDDCHQALVVVKVE